MNKDLLTEIEKLVPTFSKGQKRIAQYITDHYDKAAYMTASRLGATVGVSESTVVRFAMEIGYDGYPGLQHELQEIIQNKLTSVQRIEVSDDLIGEEDVLQKVMNADIEKIKKTLTGISRENFTGAVEAIASAPNVYILGVRSSSSLAEFMGYYFNFITKNVSVVYTKGASEVFEQLLKVSKDDVVIGISFPRYSRRTVRALEFASKRGAQVVAITDSALSPLTQYAQYTLLAKSDMASFVDSLVAPLSLINALVVAVGQKNRTHTYNTFAELEKIWAEYEVYEKTDDTDRE